MANHLRRAREAIQRASDHADGETQENLLSLDEGLGELTGGDKTGDADLDDEADRFTQIEEKLQGLIDETDGQTEQAVRDARDELDEYRRKHDIA